MKIDRSHYLFSNRDLIHLIIPLLIEQLLNFTVGMADTMMISSVGESAVSGVSLVDTVMILLINIFAALATGGAVVAGQYIGKQEPHKSCQAAGQLMLFIVLLSLVITALMYLGQSIILNGVFGAITPEVKHYAQTYLLIVTASIPFIALYNGGAALFRVMGNSNISMLTSLFMNILNIIGNAILIYGLHMGVAGAAIPTLLSRIFAAVLMIYLLKNPDLSVHLPKPFPHKFNRHYIKKILYIGVPNGLENSMFQLGKILVLSLVATFGTASIAANAVANTITVFQILPGVALSYALITVISQCVGANRYEEAKYYTKKILLLSYLSIFICNIIVDLSLPLILNLYHLSDTTFHLAMQLLLYHSICCCLIWPLSFDLPNTLRAANDVKYSMIVSIASMWIFRIAMCYVLGKYMNLGVFGVWIAMTIDWLCRSICFCWRYHRGKWQQHII